jgi:hypothetical protein
MVSGARAQTPRALLLARAPVGLVVVALCTLALGAGAGVRGAAAASLPPSVPSVRLVGQTPFVRSPGGVLSLTLTRSGPLRFHDATVQLTLFSRLTTRDGLELAIGASEPTGLTAQTLALPVRCLPGTATVGVLAGVEPNGARAFTAPRQCAGRAPILRLGCSSGCDGVYPLEVTARGGGMSSSFVTLVTFAAVSGSPLHVAWVLRVAGASHGLADSAGVLRALGAHPLVPLTIDAQGAAIARGFETTSGGTWLALLRASLSGAAHELVGEAYAPANLGAIRASRLDSEVTDQFALTGLVLRDANEGAPSQVVTYGTGPQTPTSADAIARVGYHDLLENGDALAQDPTNSLTWGAPFKFAGVPSGPNVLASDTQLSALSQQTSTDPSLVAAQFLGELAFLHFEQPNLPDPRVVTVITNATDEVSTSFVDSVLLGLARNPVLTPVTASNAFATVRVGANGFPRVRALALGPSTRWPIKVRQMITANRIWTDALATAVTTGSSPIPRIDGALLSAERVMPTVKRLELLNKVHRSLELEVGNFRIYAGPITLTGTGSTTIPITVFSNAPYGVHGVLELRSPRSIAFPQGSAIPFTLTGSVESIRVAARALVTGDLPLSVTFVSPDHNIVLARASITVRATGFSAVGIVLTVLAALVLAIWWFRTARRRRTH